MPPAGPVATRRLLQTSARSRAQQRPAAGPWRQQRRLPARPPCMGGTPGARAVAAGPACSHGPGDSGCCRSSSSRCASRPSGAAACSWARSGECMCVVRISDDCSTQYAACARCVRLPPLLLAALPAPCHSAGPVASLPAPCHRAGPVASLPAPCHSAGPVASLPAPCRSAGPSTRPVCTCETLCTRADGRACLCLPPLPLVFP